jgi:hypothetical protein
VSYSVPIEALILMLIVIPGAVIAFFGMFAIRNREREAYRCLRCDNGFRHLAHRGFPKACPRCGSTEWNLP